MHVITIDPDARVLISTRFVPQPEVWEPPHARVQLRTDTESGVILDFRDEDSLQMLSAAIRALLTDYRDHLPRPPRRSAYPVQTNLF
ncbi:MAG: hypothetical protein ACRDKL_03055 [Solirubrobacteraceae bacterium]